MKTRAFVSAIAAAWNLRLACVIVTGGDGRASLPGVGGDGHLGTLWRVVLIDFDVQGVVLVQELSRNGRLGRPPCLGRLRL